MFTEAQNFAVVQTELDTVFYQTFDYDATNPGQATARSGELFKPLDTTHASHIAEIFKGSGLFPIIGETQTVPTSTPSVANKLTVLVKDFASSINIQCQVAVRLLSKLNKFGGNPFMGAIPSQAL